MVNVYLTPDTETPIVPGNMLVIGAHIARLSPDTETPIAHGKMPEIGAHSVRLSPYTKKPSKRASSHMKLRNMLPPQ